MTKAEFIFKGKRAYHLGLKRSELAPYIFLVGDPARAYRVAAYFESLEHEVKNREYVSLTGRRKGKRFTVIGTGMGTDNIEIAITELYGIHEFNPLTKERYNNSPPLHLIRIGTSGGVQADIAPGTLGISTYALGLDNTGLYYDHPEADKEVKEIEKTAFELINEGFEAESRFRGKIYPYASKASSTLAANMVFEAQKANLPYVTGITASSPGFYGPSSRIIPGFDNSISQIKQRLSSLSVNGKRVINMEMESSILFHLCRKISYPAATVCSIISNPYSSANLIDYQASIDQAIDLAFACMESLE
ncbi:MAG: hypothetical protein AAF696_18960 [Bacteroidota bacterium]